MLNRVLQKIIQCAHVAQIVTSALSRDNNVSVTLHLLTLNSVVINDMERITDIFRCRNGRDRYFF